VLALAFLADPEAGRSAEEPTAKASRSTDGLIALYTFDGDDPGRVEDRSGVSTNPKRSSAVAAPFGSPPPR
jgi:hypothetical protein